MTTLMLLPGLDGTGILFDNLLAELPGPHMLLQTNPSGAARAIRSFIEPLLAPGLDNLS